MSKMILAYIFLAIFLLLCFVPFNAKKHTTEHYHYTITILDDNEVTYTLPEGQHTVTIRHE